MRTTLSIEESLLTRAKARAKQRGQTLGEYVESAVRKELLVSAVRRTTPDLPVFLRGTGMRPGLDPTSNRALYDALDASGDLS